MVDDMVRDFDIHSYVVVKIKFFYLDSVSRTVFLLVVSNSFENRLF